MTIKVLHLRAPIWQSRPMSESLGVPVFLKMEALQPVGSFKLRGMGAAYQHACRNGATHLLSSSGGNAGYAVAYAALGWLGGAKLTLKFQ